MDSNENEQKPRRRGLTSITLGWLAERLRKTERVKKALESGSYQIDSSSVARALVNDENGGTSKD